MKERTLRILEFNKIKDKVEKYAITSSGKEMVHSLEPFKSTSAPKATNPLIWRSIGLAPISHPPGRGSLTSLFLPIRAPNK